jgi:NAD(P)H-flavin reductase
LTLFVVDPGAVSATYSSPGQYVEVRAEGETGFFALAGEPGEATWQLIMKSGGGVSDVLLAQTIGFEVEVTGAIGVGFPMDRARGRTLLIALGGTGVAASRPLVRRRVADGDGARTEVLIGVRTRSEVPMQSDLDAWGRAGVRVVVCLSQDDGSADGLRHVQGRVQDVLVSRATRSPATAQIPHAQQKALEGAFVFAVGPTSMVDALREVAPTLGIRREDILTNH